MVKNDTQLHRAAKGLKIKKGYPQIPGAYRWENGCNFSFLQEESGCKTSLLLYRTKNGKVFKEIPLSDEFRTGKVFSVWIEGLGDGAVFYNYRCGERTVTDPWAAALTGREKYAVLEREGDDRVRGILPGKEEFLPSDVPGVFIPYSEMILYKLHVRGFTAGRQSRTAKKGTFAGLKEKIPYLQELGVTSVELMPAYDFLELPPVKEQQKKAASRIPKDLLPQDFVTAQQPEKEKQRVNYWGYTGGFYCAPKASYCAGQDAMKEFQDCVDSFHRAGMEVIMEFYFEESFPPAWIITILRYWMMTYHVDGFHLVGAAVPSDLVAGDELLCEVKIISSGFDVQKIYRGKEPQRRTLAASSGEFMGTARRFLKGNEDQVAGFIWHNRQNSPYCGIINYLACQDGFTLADAVSYNEKHNEANGENNRDGRKENESWNCGVEGSTRKQAVLALRKRQMKNAFLMLLMSQGSPMIYAGDETGNSQGGNNNAWCQDNPVGWTDWNQNKSAQEMLEFVKCAIAFRKAHPILHLDRPIRDTDYKSLGSPELSYHSERAWFSAMDRDSRSIGMMYCGEYAQTQEGKSDDYIYIAYNMYWEEKSFALPHLPEERKWYAAADTSDEKCCSFYGEYQEFGEEKELIVPPRTVMILVGR